MKQLVILFAIIGLAAFLPVAMAQDGSHGGHEGHGQGSMEHGMNHSMAAGTYNHSEVVDGIRADFQVMSLASMNMKDPGGATHHIMVKFFHDKMNHQIQEVAGKIKIISPSQKEQIGTLTNYGGTYAANFSFNEPGKWGVICLFKENGNKHVAKFWYDHK